jgi:hypothetical protein
MHGGQARGAVGEGGDVRGAGPRAPGVQARVAEDVAPVTHASPAVVPAGIHFAVSHFAPLGTHPMDAGPATVQDPDVLHPAVPCPLGTHGMNRQLISMLNRQRLHTTALNWAETPQIAPVNHREIDAERLTDPDALIRWTDRPDGVIIGAGSPGPSRLIFGYCLPARSNRRPQQEFVSDLEVADCIQRKYSVPALSIRRQRTLLCLQGTTLKKESRRFGPCVHDCRQRHGVWIDQTVAKHQSSRIPARTADDDIVPPDHNWTVQVKDPRADQDRSAAHRCRIFACRCDQTGNVSGGLSTHVRQTQNHRHFRDASLHTDVPPVWVYHAIRTRSVRRS